MEQRRLRLGDILDDYCPRERRVTNHAIVAMIEEDVKQTRCTTCDAEHAYKGARVPRRRRKETPAALYKEVLAGLTDGESGAADTDEPAPPAPAIVPASPETPAARPAPVLFRPAPTEPSARDLSIADAPQADAMETARPAEDDETQPVAADEADREEPVVDGPVHRPLIRATLPRPEGQKDARPLPEFTVRQAPGRGNGNGAGHFRGGDRMRMRGGNGHGHGHANGNRAHGGPRFSGNGNRSQGSGRHPMGRGGTPSGFRGQGGPNGKRGRGSRG